MMARLKSGTQDQHRAIERLVPLMASDLTSATYVGYLRRMLGYVQPIEAALRSVLGLSGVISDLDARAKSGWLQDDLGGAHVSTCTDLPSLTSVSAALGCMYVLEGSTLGGQILARHVAGRVDGANVSYLRSYGAEVGPMWKRFGLAVEAYAGDGATMVAAAQDTFRTLGRWLS